MEEKELIKYIEKLLQVQLIAINAVAETKLRGFVIPGIVASDGPIISIVLSDGDKFYNVTSINLNGLEKDYLANDETTFMLKNYSTIGNVISQFIIEDEPKRERFIFTDETFTTILKEAIKAGETSYSTYLETQKNKSIENKYIKLIDDILNTIKYPARSNKEGFYETKKLDVIEAYVEKIPNYSLLHKGKNSYIFGKKTPGKDDDVILVSSHSDIVKQITQVSSEHDADNHFFKGTYDNLGTNAALIYLMITNNLPENIVFAFTADEETGRCNGAAEAIDVINNWTGKDPHLCVALDVTDEGFNNKILSLEGLTLDDDQYKKVRDAFMLTEGEKESFHVIKAAKNDACPFPKSYIGGDCTMYDESIFYRHAKQHAISVCLPGDGVMHGNSGFYVKESTFVGYMLSLQYFLENYTRDTKNLSKAEIDNIERLRDFKDYLTSKTEKIKIATQTQYFHNFMTYDFDDEEEEADVRAFNASFGIQDPDEFDDLEDYKDTIHDECYTILGEGNYDSLDMFSLDVEAYIGLDTEDPEVKALIKDVWDDFHGLGYEEDESVDRPYDYDNGLTAIEEELFEAGL